MESSNLHIFFLPHLTPGHMLPMVDMAKVFAERGVKATIVTTPRNAARIRDSIDRASYGTDGHNIQLLQVNFPSSEVGLLHGCENLTAISSPEGAGVFLCALTKLRDPFEQLVKEHAPDGIISDGHYPWTFDIADKCGIPRLIFVGPSAFSLKTLDSVFGVETDAKAFVLPYLPDRVEMAWSQLPNFILSPSDHMQEIKTANSKSYGVIVNSFCELEPNSETKVFGLKTWYVGPLSLCNRDENDMTTRGEKASSWNSQGCLNWLDAQAPRSVLYVCFGSLCQFTGPQLREIALGLESSGHPFLWVLRSGVEDGTAAALPEGFEERNKGRGLILRGWAPQLLILGHQAVGGFMTHCGWNSTLEAISAGKPMVAWPLFAEQFINEKLIVHYLKVGVAVGAAECSDYADRRGLVGRERVQEAVGLLMGDGEAAAAMRERSRELAAMAREAVEAGGSSQSSISELIQELLSRKKEIRDFQNRAEIMWKR